MAIELIGDFADEDVEDRDYLMAKAYVYGGYATEFLADHCCAVVFGGDVVGRSREEGFEAAAELLTSGLELARGASHSDAGRLRNLALVGRARARLNMGDGTGAVADAQQVENGFVGYLDYQLGDPRREWWVSANDLPVNISIRSHYRTLTVEGLVDGERVVMTTRGSRSNSWGWIVPDWNTGTRRSIRTREWTSRSPPGGKRSW